MRMLRASSILSSLIATACLDGEPDDLELEPSEVVERCLGCSWGPPVLNTHVLNGLPLDALDLSGHEYHGVQLVSITVLGDGMDELVDVSVVEGKLFGEGQSGQKYQGDDFVGSVWELEDHRSGTPVATTMRITAHQAAPNHTRYTFMHTSTFTSEKEVATCDLDPYTQEASVILMEDLEVTPDGSMHDTAGLLYFGCVAGAVGKSVVWGYAPWVYGMDVHQTATRVVRADYCGDGESWTETGTGLQLRDTLGVWSFPAADEATEAIWTPDGAACIKEPRLHQQVQCANGVVLPSCGEDTLNDHPDALIHTKLWQWVHPEP